MTALSRDLFLAAGVSSLVACGGTVQIQDSGAGGSGATGSGSGASGATGAGQPGTGGSPAAGGWGTGGWGEGGDNLPLSGCYDGSEPAPLVVNGNDTGFGRCVDGSINRVFASQCSAEIENTCQGTEAALNCTSDDECVSSAGKPGRCGSFTQGDWGAEGDGTYCTCVFPCETDADCSDGSICLCAGVVDGINIATCVPSDCTTGQDCASHECGVTSYDSGCGDEAFAACRSSGDACRSDAECPGVSDDPGDNQCAPQYGGIGPWTCRGMECAIGRPLLVTDGPRTARTIARTDWSLLAASSESNALVAFRVSLDAPERSRIASHWQDVAAMEHASVASFARFVLELMSLGAPPELLAEAQQAGSDEIAHAQIAYGLAGIYGTQHVGPGKLDLSGVTALRSPEEIVRALVLEACVGETLGAAEAKASAAEAHTALRPLLEQIATDELRHAALAWKSLRWMLAEMPELRPAAQAGLSEAFALYSAPTPAGRVSAREHGVLGSRDMNDIRREALQALVMPLARELIGGAMSAPASS